MERYAFTSPTPFDKKRNNLYLREYTARTLLYKMIGNAMRNFMEMVCSGELIEHGIKNKKIEGKPTSAPPAKKATPTKKKKGNTYAVFVNQQSRGQASYAS